MLNKSLFYFALITFLISCNALVEEEFPEFSAVPVMNGLLQADSLMQIHLSLSANLSDSKPEFIDNALVVLSDQHNLLDTLKYVNDGWYKSENYAKAGSTYTCIANIPSFKALSAKTTVPYKTEIDSVVFTKAAKLGQEGENISSVSFLVRNNQCSDSFWDVKLKIRGLREDFDDEEGESVEKLLERDVYIEMEIGQDSVMLHEANPLTVFSNRKMKSDTYWLEFSFNERYYWLDDRDTMLVELNAIDESYYMHQKQYYLYESSSWNTLGSASQRYPLYSNVNNGLGLFSSSNTTLKIVKTKN